MDIRKSFTDSWAVNVKSALPTTDTNVPASNFEGLMKPIASHRAEPEGLEAVKQMLQAVGLMFLMFLLAAAGILLAFGFVMWVL